MRGTRAIALLVAAVVVVGAALLIFNDRDEGGSGSVAEQSARTDTTAADAGGENRGGPAKGARRGSGGTGGGSSDAADAQARQREQQRAASEMSEDEKQAQTVAQGFYDILKQDKGDKNSADFDTEGFCDLMSDEAREQTIDFARRSSGIAKEWDCESSVELLVARSKRTGGFRRTRQARIVGVNAEGDRATATVRFGKGPLTSIPLVKEEGEWKLGASVAAGQSGG